MAILRAAVGQSTTPACPPVWDCTVGRRTVASGPPGTRSKRWRYFLINRVRNVAVTPVAGDADACIVARTVSAVR